MNRQAKGIIAQIEQAIVDELQEALPTLKVDAWPDNMARYQLLHNKGAVLVSYRSRSAVDGGFCQNERSLSFGVTVVSRNLRQRDAHQGIYDTLEEIDAVLSAFIPPVDGCSDALEFERDSFVGEDSGIWTYTAIFKINVVFEV